MALRCVHQDPGFETGDGAGEVSGKGTRAMPGRSRGLCQAGFVFVLKLGGELGTLDVKIML